MCVMLVEIPDPEIILGIIAAFLVGVFGLYLFIKIKPYVKFKPTMNDPSHFERLEFYERQLIDMKIRLDALDLQDYGTKLYQPIPETESVEHTSNKNELVHHKEIMGESQEPRAPNMGYQNATDYVLKLITSKSMTSRDIQITLGRSREHTSRLMKKLFEDGYVKRNTNSKPYTYSITNKGKEKSGGMISPPTAA